jgi:hypothetical protein
VLEWFFCQRCADIVIILALTTEMYSLLDYVFKTFAQLNNVHGKVQKEAVETLLPERWEHL